MTLLAPILAPTLASINDMLSIVNEYGCEFNVKLNPTKTQPVAYGSYENNHTVSFDDTGITSEQSAGHLGNLLKM